MYSEVSAQGLQIKDAPFGVYYNAPDQVPAEQLKWEVGQVLAEKKELKAPLTLKRWEFTTLVSADTTARSTRRKWETCTRPFSRIRPERVCPGRPHDGNLPEHARRGGRRRMGGACPNIVPVQKAPVKQ